jgi:hypothetical protein
MRATVQFHMVVWGKISNQIQGILQETLFEDVVKANCENHN